MKKILTILIVSLILFSCSSDARIQLIADREQIIDGTKTDLSLKVLNLKELGSVTAADSLKILEQDFIKSRDNAIESYNGLIAMHQGFLQSHLSTAKTEEFKEIRDDYLRYAKEDEAHINECKEMIKKFETDCSGTILEPMFKHIAKLKRDTTRILCNKVQATYSINNPFLNNVKQELTRIYLFTPNNDSIIGVIE